MDKGQVLGSSLSLGWRLILIAAITLFVALTVGSVFSAKQDVRKAEASILAERITGCIAKEGIVEPNFDLKGCFIEDNEIYVSANLKSLETNFSRSIESGSPEMKVFCRVEQEEGKKYPSCISQKYYVLIDNKKIERGMLELSIGVKKYESNV